MSIKGESIMKSGSNPLSRRDNIVIQELQDEILIYDLRKNKALCLNKTSAMIWQECDGTKSVAEISQTLGKKLKLNIPQDLVWLAVEQFKTDNLLNNSQSVVTPFEGLTRREVIRKIGFASMVMLPVISAIIAPTALQAQSSACGPIGNCTSGQVTLCVCLPVTPVGSNINPAGCPCSTSGDCSGNCQCGTPCEAPACPGGETCQSGVCQASGGGGSGNLCNGNCPIGVTCVTGPPGDSAVGTCQGTCLPGANICVGGTTASICIPGDTSNMNPDCCPCSNVEGCQNCCNDGVCGPCIG
jgi:hypothetical protein